MDRIRKSSIITFHRASWVYYIIIEIELAAYYFSKFRNDL